MTLHLRLLTLALPLVLTTSRVAEPAVAASQGAPAVPVDGAGNPISSVVNNPRSTALRNGYPGNYGWNTYLGLGAGGKNPFGSNIGAGYSLTPSDDTQAFELTCVGYLACGGLSGRGMVAGENTAVGWHSLGGLFGTAGVDGGYDTGVGVNSLGHCPHCQQDTALGVDAMRNSNTGSDFSVAIGFQALAGNPNYTSSVGSRNIAIGVRALGNYWDNHDNIAIGSGAMEYPIHGNSNVLVGSQILSGLFGDNGIVAPTQNTITGYRAFFGSSPNMTGPTDNDASGYMIAPNVTSASYNVIHGANAAKQLTSGDYNTIEGNGAGAAITAANDNIFVGAYAGGTQTSGNGNIAIGYNEVLPLLAGSGQLSIGETIQGTLATADHNGAITVKGTLEPLAGLGLPNTAYANLPACSSSQDLAYVVTDATPASFNGGTLAGGGTLRSPVYCNGTAWATILPYPNASGAPYVGEVATRATTPAAFYSGATQSMSRSMHIAKQNLSSFQVAFANFYNNVAAHTGEAATGGTATITASIEYPAGTFTPMSNCNATTPRRIPSGSYTICNVSVTIPSNAQFWVREWYSNSAGTISVSYGASNINSPAGDAFTFGVSVPDQTLGGTVTQTASSANSQSFPIAIIAPTAKPAVCIWGDSRAYGYRDVRNDRSNDNGEIARYIGQKYAYILMGGPGDTAIGTLAATTNRAALTNAYCTAVIDEYGINDLTSRATVPSLVSARSSLSALFPTLKVFGTTLPGVVSTSDSFASQANMTVSLANGNVQRFNTSVRAGIAGEIGYVDIADTVDPGRTGKLPTNGTANATTPDGIHETNLTAALERDSTAWMKIDLGR